jgi:hypothetical protein
MFVELAIVLAALAGGAVFLHRAVKRRSGPSWFGAIVLLGPLLMLAVWCHRTDVDTWSPSVGRHTVQGRWTHGKSTLELFPDGTFRVDAHGDAARRVLLTRATGRWELDDWKLTLDPGDGYPRRMRVVVSNGEYRIIEHPGDLDTWPRWTGFNRSPSSPAPDHP